MVALALPGPSGMPSAAVGFTAVENRRFGNTGLDGAP